MLFHYFFHTPAPGADDMLCPFIANQTNFTVRIQKIEVNTTPE